MATDKTVETKLQERMLSANEILVRPQQVYEYNGQPSVVLLLYKDARVDMNILDEVVGAFNWQNSYERIGTNLYCTISIFDSIRDRWISKSNVGTESNMEAQKGEASDAFKRAGTNWGIGRELYDSPNIKIQLGSDEFKHEQGKPKLNSWIKFRVSHIKSSKNKIEELVIVDNNNVVRYALGTSEKVVTKTVAANSGNKGTVTPQNNLPPKTTPPNKQEVQSKDLSGTELHCSNCDDTINSDEKAYSERVYQQALCRNCQTLARNGQIRK